MKMLILFTTICISFISGNAFAQQKKSLVFDVGHGQAARIGEAYKDLIPENSTIEILDKEINDAAMKGKHALIIFSPTKTFQDAEKKAIIDYLRSGGSLLLLFDEERRMSLNGVGVNDFIIPFNIELTGDTPVPHNCGAIAEKSEVCAERRELPYSGGRSIKGGTVISRVYDDGDYVHSAFVKLPGGGKIVVMSDAMAGLLLGGPDGIRFSGTGPSDSKYWGKDSEVFIKEILIFLCKK